MRQRRETALILPHRGSLLTAFALGFFISACSLPDVRLDKSRRVTSNDVATFSSKTGTYEKPDKRYLASVHVRFSDSKDSTPLSFDLNRDRRRLISARLFESEETSTTVNIGYNSDGPIAGFKFNWHFD